MPDDRFHIKSDSPAVDDLMFWSIAGHEALSRASCYELTVLSRKSNINASDILGRAFDVVLDFTDADDGEHERHCQGHAVRFVRVNQRGRHYEYRITLRSWFWLLTKRRNSRIHQEKTIVEVMNAVFDDSPIQRFKKINTDHVIGKQEPRRYCVQYQESDYDFLSRLMEEEGVYYWFDSHDEAGTMYLSDASDVAHEKLPVTGLLEFVRGGSGERRFNEVSRWVSARQFDTGKTASRDSNFKTIKKKLLTERDVADDHELAEFEDFSFAGGYFNDDDAENVGNIRGEELKARRDRHWALTGWTDVCAGMTFKLEGPDADVPKGEYLIAGCTFFVSHPGYEGIQMPDLPRSLGNVLRNALSDDAVNAQTLDVLDGLIEESPALLAGTRGARAFLLTVMPLDLLFRPPRMTPSVTMPGPQSAIVVGPAGEEIDADKFGRVKVHFHWDRYDNSDEKSTCYVRVSQPWAGKGWGGYFIPRIGQEVIVDFLNGDPDRPIIMGRVYNDDQPKPFDSQTQSGFRTRSTPKGSAVNCNEFRFDDKKGNEQVYLHAEKNQDISVENDETHSVGHDRQKTIGHDETTHVKHDRTETVDNDEKITVHGKRTEVVDKNEVIIIYQNRTESVGQDESITVYGHRTMVVHKNAAETVNLAKALSIGLAYQISVGAAMNETVVGAKATEVGGYRTEKVALYKSSTVGKKFDISAGDLFNVTTGSAKLDMQKSGVIDIAGTQIKLHTGAGSILIKNDGSIEISGTDIKLKAGAGQVHIDAGGIIDIKGPMVKINT